MHVVVEVGLVLLCVHAAQIDHVLRLVVHATADAVLGVLEFPWIQFAYIGAN